MPADDMRPLQDKRADPTAFRGRITTLRTNYLGNPADQQIPSNIMQATQDMPVTAPPSADDINVMIGELFPDSTSRCVEVGETWAVARHDVTDAELRPGGFVSGPTQFGIADDALWYLVFAARQRIEPMALTSELSIRYLRPAQGRVLWARADLDVAGRRNVVGTIRVWCDDQSDRPTATAQGTYALPF